MQRLDEYDERLRKAEHGELGFDAVLPGYTIKSTSSDGEKTWVKQVKEHGGQFATPTEHTVKGVSALIDAQGRVIQQWVKTRQGAVDPAELARGLEASFADFEPSAAPKPPPEGDLADQLAVFPWADPHLGLLVWGEEAAIDWDLNTAVKVMNDAFSKVIARTPATAKAILLVGGDTMHADSNENRTPQSGHALQVDGRFPKVMQITCETIVRNADLLLSHHGEVEIIVVPGNHDEMSAYAIAYFLNAWYRNEPRMRVDTSPSLFRFREFGRVMIATTHGHAAKIKNMPAIMAAREPEMWGRTQHRYCLGFHIHHQQKTVSEGGGCITETFQIIAPQDAWHFNQGYLSGRSLQSIVYDREHGEVGRTRVAVL
jgi:hypothetical protein